MFGVLQHWVAVVTESSEGNRDFKIQRRGRQRERQKKQLVELAQQQLRTCITLFCTFLSRFCTTTTWKCLISRFIEDVNKQRRNLFLFPSLNMVPWNSASGWFAYIWQSKWLVVMKTERRQIHCLSDVLVAVVSLDLKVPNDSPNTAAMIMERNFWFCFGLSVPWRFFFFVWMSVPSKHDIWKKVALGSKMPFYFLYFLLSNLWGCWGSIKIKEACESTLHNRI